MKSEVGKPESVKTVWDHMRRAWRVVAGRRPVSFYLLLAMLAAVVLGVPAARAKDNPRQFALFLALSFVFFLVIIVRAVLEALETGGKLFSEREKLLKATLGDGEFLDQVGRRNGEKREPEV